MKKNMQTNPFRNILTYKHSVSCIIITVLTLVLMLSFIACDITEDVLQTSYNEAIVLMESEKFEEAISIFESLDGFSDSEEQIKACREAIKDKQYITAVDLMESGNYEEAIAIFKELGGYKFSATHITNCQSAINEVKLGIAISHIDRFEYSSAAAILQELGSYKNASELLAECKYYLDFVFTLNSSRDGYVISEYKGVAAEVFVPEEYAGLPVTRIGSAAFERADRVVSITVPASITEIGSYAFSECVSLQNITLPRTLTVLGKYSFADCGAIESITFIGSEDEWQNISKGENCCDSNLLVFVPECSEDHHYPVVDTAVSPTCKDDGLTEGYHCYLCGEIILAQNVVPALGHDEVSHEEQAPACEEIGWDAYVTCSKCDYTTYAEKSALGHDEVNHEAKAPACEEIGWDAYVTCSRCEYTTYAEKSTLGHDEVEHEAKAPTCEEIGWDAYVTCSRCDYTTYTEKPALGHDEVNHEAKAPTCEEIGWDSYLTCSRCDYTTYAEKSALGHDEVIHKAQAPTCEEIGWDLYVTCSRCDYTTYAEKSALGHDEVNHEAKAPACEEIGWDAYVSCSRCDYTTYSEKAALEHDIVNHGEKAATCTEIGWNAYETCSRCNYSTYAELPIDKDNHDTVVHEAKIPTCTEIGWNTYETCSRCDHSTYAELPKDENNHNEVNHDAKAPTCTSVGWESYQTCSRCDYSTYVEIKKLDHATETVEAKEPTCTETGWNEYEKCVNCSYTTQVIIPALNHDIIAKDGQEPTCASDGWSAYEICSRCDYTTYKVIVATGKHTYDNEKTCTVCLDYADKGVVFELVGEVYGVTSYTGNAKRVVIPSSYNGKPVTFIGNGAFEGNGALEAIVFTQNIRSIGENAFNECSSLASVSYVGSEEDWSGITVSDAGNNAIKNAEIVFNYDFSNAFEEISIHVIDVGQGDAILIMTPWGNMLIDSGDLGSTSRAALTSYLAKYNVTSFECVIFTHPDADHIGSGDYIMQNYDVKTVIMPDCARTTQVYSRLIAAIESSDAELVLIGTSSICEKVGYSFELGQVVFTVMGPTKKFSDSNEMSVVIKLEYGETTALFTGDAESGSEKAMLDMYKNGELDCDILKVGHHGASTSTTNAFLAAITPDVAVISCGEGNTYGHPHTETMDKLSGAGVETYRTDHHGDVVIKTDGERIEIVTEKIPVNTIVLDNAA